MGCGNAKKEVENQMMIMQLERIKVQMEREKNLKLLEDIDGCKRKSIAIPDYIDPEFLKEKNNINNNESVPLINGGNDVSKLKKKIIKRRTGKKRRKSKKQ